MRRTTVRSGSAVLVAALTVLLGTSCAGTDATRSTVGVSVGAIPNEDVVALPKDVETAVTDAIGRLPDLVREALAASGVPGAAVAVVRGGKTVFVEGFGERRKGEAARVGPDTVFQLASVSKSLSATAVAKAVGDRKVEWNTPIASLLPSFALADASTTRLLTVADLFSHRSGLSTGAGDDLEDIGYDRAYILEQLRRVPLDAFRSSYHYSNFGLTAGAEAVAAALRKPWDEVMDELVFRPLGMTTASARHADFAARPDRASLHAWVDGRFEPRFERDPDAQAPAGGVSASVRDVARWASVVLARGSVDGTPYVDEDALLAATSPQVVTGHATSPAQRPGHYGYGFNVASQPGGRVTLSHSGAFVLGAGTAFQLIPDLDLGVVVLTNAAPVGLAEAVIAQFFDLVQFGHITRDWIADAKKAFAPYLQPAGDLVDKERPAQPRPPAAAADYAGSYTSPYFGPMRVEQTPDGLVAALGPGGRYRVPLTAWDGDVFSFVPTGENAPAGSRSSATFTRSGPAVRSVRLAFFDGDGLGTFVRTS